MPLSYEAVNWLVSLIMVVGMLQCFFGYKIFKIALGLTGFFLFGALTGKVAYDVFGLTKNLALLLSCIGGVIGAISMIALYYAGIFLLGGFVGGILGYLFYSTSQNNLRVVILVILPIVTGILALIFQKLMIVISTAFGGAWVVIFGGTYLANRIIEPVNFDTILKQKGPLFYIMIICWLGLGITGLVIQYRALNSSKQALIT